MAEDLYGTTGEVLEAHKATVTLKLTYAVPSLKLHQLVRAYPDAQYMPQYQACKALGLPSSVVGRITTSLQVLWTL
jgi:hypothetical protein